MKSCAWAHASSASAGLAGPAEPTVAISTGIAVIVNGDNPVDQLSLTELERIVLDSSFNKRTYG